jgi:hypothetical protein
MTIEWWYDDWWEIERRTMIVDNVNDCRWEREGWSMINGKKNKKEMYNRWEIEIVDNVNDYRWGRKDDQLSTATRIESEEWNTLR